MNGINTLKNFLFSSLNLGGIEEAKWQTFNMMEAFYNTFLGLSNVFGVKKTMHCQLYNEIQTQTVFFNSHQKKTWEFKDEIKINSNGFP